MDVWLIVRWFLISVGVGLSQLWIAVVWTIGVGDSSLFGDLCRHLDDGILLFYANTLAVTVIFDKVRSEGASSFGSRRNKEVALGYAAPILVVTTASVTYCGYLSQSFASGRVAAFSIFAVIVAWASSLVHVLDRGASTEYS